MRDWIFVEDHCAGILAALERGRPGETYAFGASTERSNRDIVDAICRLCEAIRPAADNDKLRAAGHAPVRGPDPVRRGPARATTAVMRSTATKAREELGWTPRHAFDDALAQTVRWYAERLGHGALPGRGEADVRARRGLGDAAGAPRERA